jgi:hypothetical protein
VNDNPPNRGTPEAKVRLDPLGAFGVGRLPVRFGASKRAVNYRAPCPLINRALPRGAFFHPIPRLEAPAALYSPAKPAIFFYWRPSGPRPGRPASAAGRQPRHGGGWPACSGSFRRAPPACPCRPLHRDLFLKPRRLQLGRNQYSTGIWSRRRTTKWLSEAADSAVRITPARPQRQRELVPVALP